MAKLDAFRSSTSRRFESSMSSAICFVPASKAAVTNTYHLPNKGKTTNEFSYKECWLRGLFLFRTRLFNIFLGDISLFCLFHALEIYSYSLSFHMTTFALFFSYENPTNGIFCCFLITEIHHLQKSSSPFLSWLIPCYVNSAKPLVDTGMNTSSKGPCILLT